MATQRDVGLDEEQVDALRSAVLASRRPRVGVPAGQFPAGTTGTVVRVGDPNTDGADFITVRVKVGRVTDELGFSPKELSKGGRRGAVTASAPTVARPQTPPRTPRVRSTAKPVAEPSPAPSVARASKRPTAAGGPARRTSPGPAVTVTIASAGASWSVTASRGNRTVVKKASLAPGVVAAIAALLGQPAVDEAIAAVNDSARHEAEDRAEKLRAELAEVEAILTSHRRP